MLDQPQIIADEHNRSHNTIPEEPFRAFEHEEETSPRKIRQANMRRIDPLSTESRLIPDSIAIGS